MDRLMPPIQEGFIGQCYRNPIIDVMNVIYQIRNIPMKIDYNDPRKSLMINFLPL
jgi:hypothetical protein